MIEALRMIYPLNDDSEIVAIQQWCKAKNLDPLNKPCYITYKNEKPRIVPTINGYVALCHQSGQLAGISKPEYSSDDQSCTVTVTRLSSSRQSPGSDVMYANYTAGPVYFADYANSDDHRKYPKMFLANWALAKSLKLAFADIIGGLPTDVELDSAIRFAEKTLENVDLSSGRIRMDNGSQESVGATPAENKNTVTSTVQSPSVETLDFGDLLDSIDLINKTEDSKKIEIAPSEDILKQLDIDMDAILSQAQVAPVNVISTGESCDLDLHQRINIDNSDINAQIADLFND